MNGEVCLQQFKEDSLSRLILLCTNGYHFTLCFVHLVLYYIIIFTFGIYSRMFIRTCISGSECKAVRNQFRNGVIACGCVCMYVCYSCYCVCDSGSDSHLGYCCPSCVGGQGCVSSTEPSGQLPPWTERRGPGYQGHCRSQSSPAEEAGT